MRVLNESMAMNTMFMTPCQRRLLPLAMIYLMNKNNGVCPIEQEIQNMPLTVAMHQLREMEPGCESQAKFKQFLLDNLPEDFIEMMMD